MNAQHDARMSVAESLQYNVSNAFHQAMRMVREGTADEARTEFQRAVTAANQFVSELNQQVLPNLESIVERSHEIYAGRFQRYYHVRVRNLGSAILKATKTRPRCSVCNRPLAARVVTWWSTSKCIEKQPFVGMRARSGAYRSPDHHTLTQQDLDNLLCYGVQVHGPETDPRYEFIRMEFWSLQDGFCSGKTKLQQKIDSVAFQRLYAGIPVSIPADRELCHRVACGQRLLVECMPVGTFAKFEPVARGEGRGFDI